MVRLVSTQKQSLKEFTENNYAQAGFYFHALLKAREIKVNGKRVGENVPLVEGDEVCYYLTPKQEGKKAFSSVYEDENILVIDKESGVNAEAVYAELQRRGEYYFIHRLDRNTEGLMAFACNIKAEEALLQAFKERRVEKRYHALCYGSFLQKSGVLTGYLKKDGENARVFVYDKAVQGGERICTEYEVLAEGDGKSKVEVLLHTGKTHQIRAHLAHVGHPIVGDMKYGDGEKNRAEKLARQCLVAKSLQFTFEGELSYLNDKKWFSKFDVEI